MSCTAAKICSMGWYLSVYPKCKLIWFGGVQALTRGVYFVKIDSGLFQGSARSAKNFLSPRLMEESKVVLARVQCWQACNFGLSPMFQVVKPQDIIWGIWLKECLPLPEYCLGHGMWLPVTSELVLIAFMIIQKSKWQTG